MLPIARAWLPFIISLLLSIVSTNSVSYASDLDCSQPPQPPSQPDDMNHQSALGRYYDQCLLDYDRAKQAFDHSLASAQQRLAPHDPTIAIAKLNRLRLELDWQEPWATPKAWGNLISALTEIETTLRGEDRHAEALMLLADAHYYAALNTPLQRATLINTAQHHYQSALKHQQLPAEAAITHSNLANTYRLQEDYQQEAAHLTQVANLLASTKQQNTEAYALNRYKQAENHRKQHHYSQAEPAYQDSLQRYQTFPPTLHRDKAIARIQLGLAETHLQQQRYAQAHTAIEQAAQFYLNTNTTKLNHGTLIAAQDDLQDRQRFARLQLRFSSHPATSRFTSSTLPAAFWAIQQLHGLERLQGLQQALMRLSIQNPKHRESISNLWKTYKTLEDNAQYQASTHQAAESQRLQQALNEAEQQLQKTLPAYRQLAQAKPLALNPDNTLSNLRKGEALLAWVFERDPQTQEPLAYVLVAAHQRPAKLYALTLLPDFQQDIIKLRQAMTPQSSTLPDFDLQTAHRLYQTLFAPVVDDLQEIQHLIVVTDDELQHLPLHLLVTQAPTSRDYQQAAWLMQQYTFNYLPAVNALKSLRELPSPPSPDPRKRFLGIGAPLGRALSGAEAELEHQHQLLCTAHHANTACSVLTAKDATEQALKQLIDPQKPETTFQIISFATHAAPHNTQDNTEAFLELGKTKDEDGRVTASEIMALTLDADIVLLSACSTGSISDTTQGMSSLVKAFFSAGSRQVLATAWDIDSPTTQTLMQALFTALPTTSTHWASALQHAMQHTLQKNAEHAHPFYWGAFQLYGLDG